MQVKVETIRSQCSGFENIAEIAEKTDALLFDSVVLDFKPCTFFEANMAAALYIVIARLRNRVNDVSIINVPDGIQTILRKNRFLCTFNISELPDTNQTTFPFKIFKLTAEEQFNDYLETYMNGRGIPEMSKELAKRFKQSLFELFINAAIHSESDSGIFLCGQFYPQLHRVDFTIADAGIGIPKKVQTYLGMKTMDSCDAIQWALTEGNTTKTGRQPGGLGLKLIKDFIQINKGSLQIVSRFGYYEFSAGGEVYQKLDHDFPGTCINIEINTNGMSRYFLKSELENEEIF
jgi:signal transduction histidine kinase